MRVGNHCAHLVSPIPCPNTMVMKVSPPLLLCVACLTRLLPMPGNGTLCLRGEGDLISLCAMCSDKQAAVRWNISDSVTRKTLMVKYTCQDPQNSNTQVLNSDQDPCHNTYPPFSDLYTGVATIRAEIATGVRCDFSIVFRHAGGSHLIVSNCIIRSTELCETIPEQCQLDQVCGVHQGGSCSECYCTHGYVGEECTNINECASNSPYPCHEQAECYDTEGSYKCECKTGYEGDGHYCSDINECEHINNSCHKNAKCTNSDGSFSCKCNAGYRGDGYSTCSGLAHSTNVFAAVVSGVVGGALLLVLVLVAVAVPCCCGTQAS